MRRYQFKCSFAVSQLLQRQSGEKRRAAPAMKSSHIPAMHWRGACATRAASTRSGGPLAPQAKDDEQGNIDAASVERVEPLASADDDGMWGLTVTVPGREYKVRLPLRTARAV